MMINKEYKDIAQWTIDCASRNGCRASRVSVVIADNNTFEYRNRQFERLQQSTENKLYIELFVDGRYGTLSTNRIEKAGLEDFIKEGIISTRYLSEDICRRLPDNGRYYRTNGVDLDLFDKSFYEIPTDKKLDISQQSIAEIYDSDSRIISVSSSYSDGVGTEYMVTSNGFEGESTDSAFSLMVEVSLKAKGDARAESYWYDNAIYWNDLKAEGIGETALRRALGKIGQQKIDSGKYDMLLDNMTASRFLSPLIGAMYGSALQQKNSFLLDKLGEKIASEKLTLCDSPHLARSFGARLYDGEGIATSERKIIDKGVLQNYFIDTYNSLKMGVEPTISSPSVLQLTLGDKDFDSMVKLVQKGIWITDFNGGNSNPTTGDFSFGIEGFLIKNGKLSTPLSEMNVTGNILSLWANLSEVGNDPRSSSSWRVPSLLFRDVNFSGL